MKYNINRKLIFSSIGTLVLALFFTSCERDVSDDAVLATYPNTADIFTDSPVGLTDAFFESFDPATGANTQGFGTDNTVAKVGKSSIRIDVPAPNDPNGGYIGGVFRDRGVGRDLTGYDALTFWVKGSRTATIGTVGFGTDFVDNKYAVSANEIPISTDWRKIIIPIPDASKLIQEKGMFLFSAGTQNTGNVGFTFWIDELRFEKLGNISLLNAKILSGQDKIVDGFLNSTHIINQLSVTSNLSNNQNISVNVAPSYFNFYRSDSSLPLADQVLTNFALIGAGPNNGQIATTVKGATGSAVITAQLGSTLALGSLKINAAGAFVNAPIPNTNPANVISIFSDTYSKIAGFNPGIFAGPNTGNISAPVNDGDQHINYQSIDYIGMGWNGTVNVSSKTMMHLHVKLIGAASSNLKVELIDFGPDGIDNGFGGAGGGTAGGKNVSSQLIKDQWVSLNIPLNQFTLATGGGGAGNPNKNNLGFIVLVSSNGASVLVDNIYFY